MQAAGLGTYDAPVEAVAPGCAPGRREIAVKVVDIFGNDMMTIVEVAVEKNGGKQ